MNATDKLFGQVIGAIRHSLEGNGPASVRVVERDGNTVAAVVFVIPGPAGKIVEDALSELYDFLGWTIAKEGHGEV